MKADSLRISKVFSSGGDVHYVLPHFQREYAWEKTEWQALLTDVFSVYDVYPQGDDESMPLPEHFMGSIVVINDGARHGVIPVFKLVDGQQRLTTISLILYAFARLVAESQPAIAKKAYRLLVNEDESDGLYFKVLPTTKYGDREVYAALIKNELPLPQTESRIPQAFNYIYEQLSNKINSGQVDPERLFLVLNNALQVVFIDLNQQERPYEIFESLNAKGKQLTQADLVRNYIAMRLPEVKQETVFNKHWSPIETLLQEKRQVARLGEITAFLRHYLAIWSGQLPNAEHVYPRFRDRIEGNFKETDEFIAEIARLHQFAIYYDRLLRPENEPNSIIRAKLQRLTILEISTAYPFLLSVYDALRQGRINEDDFVEVLAILENYLVRRYLAGEPTNYLNKMFPTLINDIDPAQFVESLRQVLMTKNYPTDTRLQQAIATREIYDNRSNTRMKIQLILETINRHLSSGTGGFTVLDQEPTIEHIMPQTLSDVWKQELGPQWPQIHNDYLHTLGNLTLITQEWNSMLSNTGYKIKQQQLVRHALRLNDDYFSRDIPYWNDVAIRDRANYLTQQIVEIWPMLAEPSQKSVQTPKPRAVELLGETFAVESWRDVAYYTAETVSQWVGNFDVVAEQLPAYFQREKFQRHCRQLSNGWWLYLHLSGDAITNLCLRLLSAANIPEDEWQLITEEQS